MAALEHWDSFCLLVGGAAGALIGLQFVVLTLIAERPQIAAPDAGAAFATPTVVHFGAALLLSALMRVPWHTIGAAALAWGIAGLCGAIYMVIVGRRMRRQKTYQPDWEDWLCHFVLPLITYAVLPVAALVANAHDEEASFAVGASTLLLLFIGVHNSWDTIAYNVFVRMRDSDT